jgi:predicted Fe-S protein YdhL (DUF1289 family)
MQHVPPVPSPCNAVCTLDAADICIGCGRSAAEITAWLHASEAERRRISQRAAGRRAAACHAARPSQV